MLGLPTMRDMSCQNTRRPCLTSDRLRLVNSCNRAECIAWFDWLIFFKLLMYLSKLPLSMLVISITESVNSKQQLAWINWHKVKHWFWESIPFKLTLDIMDEITTAGSISHRGVDWFWCRPFVDFYHQFVLLKEKRVILIPYYACLLQSSSPQGQHRYMYMHYSD